jgi:hypothetical protein
VAGLPSCHVPTGQESNENIKATNGGEIMINEITINELENLYRAGDDAVKEYADNLEKAILECLVQEHDTIKHLIEIGHYPEEMEVFNSMPTYVTMSELSNKDLFKNDLASKTEIFQSRLLELMGQKGILVEEVLIDGKAHIVFFFDFDEGVTSSVKEYYLGVTKGKFEWMVESINSALRYKAKKMERSLVVWFNGKNGFPEVTFAEHRALVQYYDERKFKDLGRLQYSHEDLSHIKLKISF